MKISYEDLLRVNGSIGCKTFNLFKEEFGSLSKIDHRLIFEKIDQKVPNDDCNIYYKSWILERFKLSGIIERKDRKVVYENGLLMEINAPFYTKKVIRDNNGKRLKEIIVNYEPVKNVYTLIYEYNNIKYFKHNNKFLLLNNFEESGERSSAGVFKSLFIYFLKWLYNKII